MDTAKKFKPHTILLWEKVAGHPEAQRIVNLFPSANIKLIKHQRYTPPLNTSMSKALIQGKRTLMIGETSSFVKNFNGNVGDNIHCCPYYKLVPLSNGCPYYCTYCYLAFVYRKYSPFIKININYDTMFKQVRKALKYSTGKISFNMGEMLDSLALDHVTNLTKSLVPFFSCLPNAYLMLLTKSCNVDNLLSIKPVPNVVVSWSLNPQAICEQYEPGTASMTERLEAAKTCQAHGYRIRYQIDPCILYPNWKSDYADLIQKIFTETEPECITLGMIRCVPGHNRIALDAYGTRAKTLFSYNFVKEPEDGKLCYPLKQRVEFYGFLIEAIRSFHKNVPISLCRETAELWDIFSNRCDRHKCNCINW